VEARMGISVTWKRSVRVSQGADAGTTRFARLVPMISPGQTLPPWPKPVEGGVAIRGRTIGPSGV